MARIKISESNLRRAVGKLLNEITIDDFPNPPARKPHLGRIAFADQREDLPPNIEPNTEFERMLFSSIENAVMANGALSDEEISAIRSFIRSNHYSDVFSLTTAPVLYRGLFMDRQLAQEYLALSDEDMPEPGSGVRTVKASKRIKSINFEERGPISSWADSYEPALWFATQPNLDLEPDSYGVVLKARLSDNKNLFLDLHKLIKQFFKGFAHQREHLAFGDVKIYEYDIFESMDSPYWSNNE